MAIHREDDVVLPASMQALWQREIHLVKARELSLRAGEEHVHALESGGNGVRCDH